MAAKSILEKRNFTVGDAKNEWGVPLDAPTEMIFTDYLKKKGMTGLAKLINRAQK